MHIQAVSYTIAAINIAMKDDLCSYQCRQGKVIEKVGEDLPNVGISVPESTR
jgi:hypothetical protein